VRPPPKQPVKKLPASSSALTEPKLPPTTCNHYGGRHPTVECRRRDYPDINPNPSILWKDSEQGKATPRVLFRIIIFRREFRHGGINSQEKYDRLKSAASARSSQRIV
jgi:hypothetical protein